MENATEIDPADQARIELEILDWQRKSDSLLPSPEEWTVGDTVFLQVKAHLQGDSTSRWDLLHSVQWNLNGKNRNESFAINLILTDTSTQELILIAKDIYGDTASVRRSFKATLIPDTTSLDTSKVSSSLAKLGGLHVQL
jgi:hypothetical protein